MRERLPTLVGLPLGPKNRAAKYGGGQLGSSVIEVVIVLTLATILLVVAIPSIRGAFAREDVDAWARAMTREISAGAQAAMTRRTTTTVTLTSSTYTVTAGGITLRRETLPPGISITTTCPGSICSFNRRGTPAAAATITLASSSSGRMFTIVIEAGTGRVSYSEP